MATSDQYTSEHPGPLLQIQDLHVESKQPEGLVRPLRGVNLEVADGESVALLGESGCGKSVLPEAILRILPKPAKITQGDILWRQDSDGTSEYLNLAKMRERHVRQVRGTGIAIFSPEPKMSLSPIHKIGAQVAEVIRLYRKMRKKEAQEEAVQLLRWIGVTSPQMAADAYASDLPSWTRQLALMAMSVAGNPRLLIVDEPTQTVDMAQQARILELLPWIREEMGMAMLITADNPAVATELAQRVAVMYLGRVIETASSMELLSASRHPYTQGLLKMMRQRSEGEHQRLWVLEGTTPPPHARIPGCPFHPRCRLFMPGICNAALPESAEVKPGHTVACYRHGSRPQETP